MPQRIAAILSVLAGLGRVPRPLQVPVSIAGALVLALLVTVWVRYAWSGPLTAELLVFTTMVLLIGLAALFSGEGK